MASRKITDLSIPMRRLAEDFIARCNEVGLDIVIICTHRSAQEQQAAYDAKLSNCKPWESAHNRVDSMFRPSAEAFDVGVIRHGKYIGNGNDPDYLRAGEIGEKIGLVWSGLWKGRLREVAHFERKNWKTE